MKTIISLILAGILGLPLPLLSLVFPQGDRTETRHIPAPEISPSAPSAISGTPQIIGTRLIGSQISVCEGYDFDPLSFDLNPATSAPPIGITSSQSEVVEGSTVTLQIAGLDPIADRAIHWCTSQGTIEEIASDFSSIQFIAPMVPSDRILNITGLVHYQNGTSSQKTIPILIRDVISDSSNPPPTLTVHSDGGFSDEMIYISWTVTDSDSFGQDRTDDALLHIDLEYLATGTREFFREGPIRFINNVFGLSPRYPGDILVTATITDGNSEVTSTTTFTVTPSTTTWISGSVLRNMRQGIGGVNILVNGTSMDTTSSDGSFAIRGLVPGSYTVTTSHTGTTPQSYDFTLAPGSIRVANFIVWEQSQISARLDIRPGSTDNPINTKSKGKIPVAILGASDFDVRGIEQSSLRFGSTGREYSLNYIGNGRPQCNYGDVNSDGLEDIQCKFTSAETFFKFGDTLGYLVADLISGEDVLFLADTIRIVGTESDRDGDGVERIVENEGPNDGDGNHNHLLDDEEGGVVATRTANSEGWMTVDISCGWLESVEAGAPTLGNGFPNGRISYLIRGCDTASVEVSVFVTGIEATSLAKYINGNVVLLDGEPESIDGSTSVFRYTISDGGILDEDGEVNGSISDSSGVLGEGTVIFSSSFESGDTSDWSSTHGL